MQNEVAFFEGKVVLMALSLSGCWGRSYDELVDCKTLGSDFFSDRTRVYDEFPDLPLDRKYIVYICGVQAVRPPLVELEERFASEGAAVVPFLVSKLEETTSDESVTDILRIFWKMQINNSFAIGQDENTMARIEARVRKLGSKAEKANSEELVAKMRASR